MPATPTTEAAEELFPAQIVIRTDRHTREAFKDACQHIPGGMQAVLSQYIEATIKHHTDRQARHMNGELCPLSAMIEQLVVATKIELSLQSVPNRALK